MTPYQYVNNNPINIIDPTGMYGERWEGGGHGDKKGDSFISKAWTTVKSWFGNGKPKSTITVGPIEEDNYSSFSQDKFANDWKNIKERSGWNHMKKYYDSHDFGLPGASFAKEGGSNLDAPKGNRNTPWIDMDWLFALMEAFKIGPETKIPGVADVHTPDTFGRHGKNTEGNNDNSSTPKSDPNIIEVERKIYWQDDMWKESPVRGHNAHKVKVYKNQVDSVKNENRKDSIKATKLRR